MKILAIITARGGSKRLPNKNILNLYGKPLIAWTIEEAKKSKYINKLIVSTDSNKIPQIAMEYGVEVSFIRPDYLAEDNSNSISVLKHAIEFYDKQFDYVILLQPTSPLKTVNDIDKAIELINDNVKAVVSVCKTEHSPLWSNTLPDDYSMKEFVRNDIKNTRSQDLPIYYRLNGAIYIANIDYFLENHGFLGKNTMAYIMDQKNSIDIDTKLDFLIAETILKNREY